MRLVKTILLFILFAIAVIFTVQNMQTVKLTFLKYYIEIPLSFASVLIYVLGAISGGLLFSMLKKLTFEKKEEKNNFKQTT
jgi:uncharacterized integral membrane protein